MIHSPTFLIALVVKAMLCRVMAVSGLTYSVSGRTHVMEEISPQ